MTDRLRLALVLAIFAGLSVAYAVRVPMFEGPDEPTNLEYLRFLDREGRLARPSATLTPELEVLERGILPPLWFLFNLPVFRALGAGEWSATPILNPDFLRHPGNVARAAELGRSRDELLAEPYSRLHFLHGLDEAQPRSAAVRALILLRLTSVPWGLLALLLTHLALTRVLGSQARALWYTAFLAFTPQLQFLSANINMDAMLAAAGALFFYAAVEWQLAATPSRRLWFAALAGLAVGLAAEIKLNGLVLAAPLVLAAWPSLRARRFREPLVAGCVLLLTLAPFYLWGWIESGHPLWIWNYQLISPMHHPAGQVPADWSLQGTWTYHLVLFLTWFADIGWTAVWFAPWISYSVMALFTLGAGLGVARVFRFGRPTRASSELRSLLWLFTVSALLILATELWFNQRFSQPQGRHLYPFPAVVVFPVCYGLERVRLLKPAVLLFVVLSFFAFPALVERLRPTGWNQSAWVAVTDQGRHAEPAGSPRAPGIELLSWLSGADDEGGRRLSWAARPNHSYELLMAIDNPEFADRPWAPDGVLLRSSVALGVPLESSTRVPSYFWDAIPEGAKLYFQVLELDAKGQLSARSDVLERLR